MPDDWNAYQRLVLSDLEWLKDAQEETNKRLEAMATDIALLRLKSGVWGLLGGFIPAAVLVIYQFVK